LLTTLAILAADAYLRAMPRKPLSVPPAAAKAFVKNPRAFHAAQTGLKKGESAARQLRALREHLQPGYG
jgi:hypothetical protein